LQIAVPENGVPVNSLIPDGRGEEVTEKWSVIFVLKSRTNFGRNFIRV